MLIFLFYFLTTVIVAITMLFLRQKEFFIKLLYLNYLTNLICVFIVTLGTFKYNESFLSIALIYPFLSFIANQAILKYFIKYKNDK